jgi:hypothetical protein
VKRTCVSYAGLGLLALAGAAFAQEKPEPEVRKNVMPLKVQLTIARQLAEKKVSSLSYAFPCNANDRKALVKVGVEVPVPVRKGEGLEFQYRNVGANIECEALALPEGGFNLRFAVEQSSLYTASGAAAPAASARALADQAESPPMFRTSTSVFSVVLRDGQATQMVAGTDPITGEVVTFDVTLTAVK